MRSVHTNQPTAQRDTTDDDGSKSSIFLLVVACESQLKSRHRNRSSKVFILCSNNNISHNKLKVPTYCLSARQPATHSALATCYTQSCWVSVSVVFYLALTLAELNSHEKGEDKQKINKSRHRKCILTAKSKCIAMQFVRRKTKQPLDGALVSKCNEWRTGNG